MNSVTLVGTVAHLKHGTTNSGVTWTNFTVKTERRFSSKGEQKTQQCYIRCSAWGDTGSRAIDEGLIDGSTALIMGYLQSEKSQDGAWSIGVNAQQVAVVGGGARPRQSAAPAVAPAVAPQAPVGDGRPTPPAYDPAMESDLPF